MKKTFFFAGNFRLIAYFSFLAIIGTLLLNLPFFYKSGEPIAFIDSLFVTVSAICVTGLSTVDVSVFSNSGLFLLMILIEAGGLGIITFFVMYLVTSDKRISLVNRRLLRDFFIDDVEINPRRILFKILTYTFSIQIVGFILLSIFLKKSGEDNFLFYGLFLSVSAFCNAGFSPYSDSLAQFTKNPGILLSVSFLIISGGIGFTVMQNVAHYLQHFISTKIFRKGRIKKAVRITLHTKIVLVTSLTLLVAGTIIVLLSDWNKALASMSFSEKLLNAFFESVTLRTAGFETIPQASFGALTIITAFILMTIGGSPASTAGGVKTTSVFMAYIYAFRNTHDRSEITVFNRDIPNSLIGKSFSIVVKALVMLFIASGLLCLSEGVADSFTVAEILFEATSAFGTVGLSMGITSSLSILGKCVIIVTMFAGRLGLATMAINAGNEQGFKNITDYPHENVIIG